MTAHRRRPRKRRKPATPPASVPAWPVGGQDDIETADLDPIILDLHRPLTCVTCGSPLLDGLRGGIAGRGWSLAELVVRTDCPVAMLQDAVGWKPRDPQTATVRWALILDALAAANGRAFTPIANRRSTLGMQQVGSNLLHASGWSWEVLQERLGSLIPAGTEPWSEELHEATDACVVFDRIAMAVGMAMILVSRPQPRPSGQNTVGSV